MPMGHNITTIRMSRCRRMIIRVIISAVPVRIGKQCKRPQRRRRYLGCYADGPHSSAPAISHSRRWRFIVDARPESVSCPSSATYPRNSVGIAIHGLLVMNGRTKGIREAMLVIHGHPMVESRFQRPTRKPVLDSPCSKMQIDSSQPRMRHM